mgnify:FL=1
MVFWSSSTFILVYRLSYGIYKKGHLALLPILLVEPVFVLLEYSFLVRGVSDSGIPYFRRLCANSYECALVVSPCFAGHSFRVGLLRFEGQGDVYSY